MPARADDFDLAGLRLSAGEGRRVQLEVEIEPLMLSGERYAAAPARVPVTLDVSRLMGGGYALRLRFVAAVAGACMRCLKPAAPMRPSKSPARYNAPPTVSTGWPSTTHRGSLNGASR